MRPPGDSAKVSVIVPCLNEEGNIAGLVERISTALSELNFEIILIDDGSTDKTIEVAERIRSEKSYIKIHKHASNFGIVRAWQTGIEDAVGEIVCLIDADLQNPPEAIKEMIDCLIHNQADLVQGIRSSIGRTKNQRMIFSKGLNWLLNFIFWQNAADSKSGFVVGYRRVLADVLDHRLKYFYFQTFIGVVARCKKYKVLEVETLFDSRESGRSFINRSNIFLILVKVLSDFVPAFFEFRFISKPQNMGIPRVTKFSQKGVRSKIYFHSYFSTMKFHKWIISSDSKWYYYFLKSTEFLEREKLVKLQNDRLQKLLHHTYQQVPYYRKSFQKSGLNLQSLIEINKIPLLSKSDVRTNIHFSMFSDDHVKKQMLRVQTSGSTGQPFICYADKFQLEMRLATTLRALEMTGWRFGDKQLRLWHQTLGMSRKQAFQEKIDSILLRRKFVPAFEMTEVSVSKLFSMIERYRPVLIDGYAESLNFISMFAPHSTRRERISVMSSAQQLTPETRNLIREKLNARVFDKYGSREFSGIAYQCAEGKNFHVQDESYIVEILVDGRKALPGEVGELVITDLNNFSVPLIRYRIGDLALAVEQTPCPCGRSHSQIGMISGRTQALVLCANGVWLPGTFFAHFFKDFQFAIQHFQIVQMIPGAFSVKIIPTSRYSTEIESQIRSGLYRFTGSNTGIEFIRVAEIPMEITGKRTPVISKVSVDFQKIRPEELQASRKQEVTE
jgi:phenylacetate-CoA ligase